MDDIAKKVIYAKLDELYKQHSDAALIQVSVLLEVVMDIISKKLRRRWMPLTKLQRRVLDYLNEHISITVRECVNIIGTTELRKVISDLRKKGVMIYDHEEKSVNRFGDIVHYKRYFIVPKEEAEGSQS